MIAVPIRRHWRWVVVASATALLVSLPRLVAARPFTAPSIAPEELAARILSSGPVAYQGYVDTRGTLELPDVPRTGRATTLLGEPSALRAWVASPTSWRVDELSTVGEHDTYHIGTTLWVWDSQERRVRRSDDTAPTRVVRSNDLLPPELARRLLAGAAASELEPLGALRVAGRAAAGIRVRPSSSETTIGTIDIWADPATGLAVRVAITGRGDPHPSVVSRFLQLDEHAPAAEQVRFTPPRGVQVDGGNGTLDLLQIAGRFGNVALPAELAGSPRTTPGAVSDGNYGSGFTLVNVAAVRQRDAGALLGAEVPSTVRSWGGEARVLVTPLMSVLVVTTRRATYAMGGAVTVDVLDRYANALTQLDRGGS